MTIQEYVSSLPKSQFWLCPNVVSENIIKLPPFFSGFDCTTTTIPEDLKDRKITKTFKEDKTYCVIWENIPYVNNHYCYEQAFSNNY